MKRPYFLFLALAYAFHVSSVLAYETTLVEDFDSAEDYDDYEESLLLSDASSFEERVSASPQEEKNLFPSQASSGKMVASALPKFHGRWGVVFFGDFLYWKANEEGLDYGLQQPFTPDFRKGPVGTPSSISPGYESGYRVGADILLPYDSWDFLAQWTSYGNNSRSSIGEKTSEFISPFFLNGNFNPTSLGAKAKWHLDYDVLDVELGRSFFVAKHLSIRPVVGFRAAWIEQELKVDYIDVSFRNAPFQQIIKSKNRNHFQGYGMRAGIDTKWPFWRGFSFLGNVAGSLLWSDFSISQFEKNADDSPRTHLRDKQILITAVVEMFGGISFETQFHRDRFYLSVYGGWEEQVWFDQNQLNVFLTNSIDGNAIGVVETLQGNLTLSGWTIGAKFGF